MTNPRVVDYLTKFVPICVYTDRESGYFWQGPEPQQKLEDVKIGQVKDGVIQGVALSGQKRAKGRVTLRSDH